MFSFIFPNSELFLRLVLQKGQRNLRLVSLKEPEIPRASSAKEPCFCGILLETYAMWQPHFRFSVSCLWRSTHVCICGPLLCSKSGPRRDESSRRVFFRDQHVYLHVGFLCEFVYIVVRVYLYTHRGHPISDVLRRLFCKRDLQMWASFAKETCICGPLSCVCVYIYVHIYVYTLIVAIPYQMYCVVFFAKETCKFGPLLRVCVYTYTLITSISYQVYCVT